ncbi:tRNA:m(4)X modification enzyme TRM13 homolog isoform X2 [Bicyclus anynana]|uniref:tRNA:m(4)X modification enzyme TRM13 n=1 Tax=Bicyclus anynana TaxID=110368 RepID=A0A6J1NYH7_BICAN|nr:tRNA:m(4)X modification enzyme TRM13 homolog isoform X2 [Bicyclus anynana]
MDRTILEYHAPMILNNYVYGLPSTCYARKLEKHLSICNARQHELPDYIVHNINAPSPQEDSSLSPRLPLSQIPLQKILQVIHKVNVLYDTYLKDSIVSVPEQPIHSALLQEFSEAGRTESSRRHLRQVSSLMHLMESERLVADNTAYVELGAGKGQLSYYVWQAWGATGARDSRVLLVDRAALRHKRDNKLRDSQQLAPVTRLRADLAHLLLERVPAVQHCAAVVGFAKHLCGVATDLALHCISASGVCGRVRGVVLAPCCHHRCERAAYPAAVLQDLGVDADDFNTLLGIVSWATCGDGRSRDRRKRDTNGSNGPHNADSNDASGTHNTDKHEAEEAHNTEDSEANELHDTDKLEAKEIHNIDSSEASGTQDHIKSDVLAPDEIAEELGSKHVALEREQRAAVGRRAKALLDWGRVLQLRARGFQARLVHYVPAGVSLENVCIVATKPI